MKKSLFFLLTIFMSFSVVVFAQDDDTETPVCKQPIPSKFDEFEYKNLEAAKEKLDLFGLQIKNQNATAVIIGYGGKVTKANEGRLSAMDIKDYLAKKFNFENYSRVSVWDGGYREKPSIELFIKAQYCSSDPERTPTLGVNEVTYKEETEFFSKDISKKSIDEMEKLVTYKVDPPYPAAAGAVRAGGIVLIFVTVDENGNVAKSQAMDGHPLLRQAAEQAVRNWKYLVQTEENKPVKFGGKVIIDFEETGKKNPNTIY